MIQSRRVLLTGAAGTVGRSLRRSLAGQFALLRLSDRPGTDLGAAAQGEEIVYADLTDPGQVQEAAQGMDAIIHLGGISTEGEFGTILDVNIAGMHHLMEAALQEGVRRVVFASSVHAAGFYPRSETVSAGMPVRPDTYYGVSKVFAEALGRMYWHKYGLEFVAVRIYSFAEAPENRRHLSSWLSPGDAAQLFGNAISAPGIGFLTVAGTSANTRKWVTEDGWDALGYAPQDNAEVYAEALPEEEADPSDPAEQYQGGVFTRREFTDKHRSDKDRKGAKK